MPGMSDAPGMYRFFKRVLTVVNPFFPVTVHGIDNVPVEGPAILASNHLSFVDSIVLPVNLSRPVYFLGKADYWDSWRTRWFFQGVGVVPIQRTGGSSSGGALATGVEILGRGELLGIYPEGTRSPDGRLYRGKTGPLRMALEAGAPVVPCAVTGSDLAQPAGRLVPTRHPITVRYGTPLDFSHHADQRDDPFTLRAATDELMYEIMLLSGQSYVDDYAADVKSGAASGDGPAGDEPGKSNADGLAADDGDAESESAEHRRVG